MQTNKTVKLRASAVSPSHSLSHISVRDLTFAIDEPVARGGTNLGPTPTDTALSALMTVEADGPATQAELDLVSAEVGKYCPLAKLFRQAGTVIEEDWKPKQS